VQFQCTKCGQKTVVELMVTKRPDMTVVISPLPSFARGSCAGGDTGLGGQYRGLNLPAASHVVLLVVSGRLPEMWSAVSSGDCVWIMAYSEAIRLSAA
jgi:hypothetical protein